MDVTDRMKKAIEKRKTILGERLALMYENNKRIITNRQERRVEQRRKE